MVRPREIKIILASGSPRRQELIRQLDIPFEVAHVSVEENYPKDLKKDRIPLYLAKLKSSGYKEELQSGEVLITADTIVLCNGEALGKPKDAEDAKRMLKLLSGREHYVLTGCFLRSAKKSCGFTARTKVTFKKLSQKEIDYYVTNYKPFDKAGAYAVQEWIGFIGITGIEGSYFNVVGLPVQRLYSALKKFVD